MAEYIVAYREEGESESLDDTTAYIQGWKRLASNFSNQFLLLEISDGIWRMYDSQGKELGGEDYILAHFNAKTVIHNISENKGHKQLIYFGAPGTGKSHALSEKAVQFGKHYERVTFYPAYSYQQFVGTYKPTMNNRGTSASPDTKRILSILGDKEKNVQEKYDALYNDFNSKNQLTRLPLLLGISGCDGELKTKKADGTNTSNDNGVEVNHGKALKEYVSLRTPDAEQQISYEYVPGPFLRLLVKALQNPQVNYLLIIEELNRANAASVFGDLFQLLDRQADGTSEYPVTISEDLRNFLEKTEANVPEESKLIKIKTVNYTNLSLPANLYIWATMNSADQGVFPMDTAFKRRWEFEYLDIDANEQVIDGYYFPFKDGNYEWNTLRKTINEHLLVARVNEDKLLGSFFIKLETIADETNEPFLQAFKSKVLMYLFEDAIRHNPMAIFNDGLTSYSKICKKLDEEGIAGIFRFPIPKYAGNSEDGNSGEEIK